MEFIMYLVTGASGQLGRAVINHLLTAYKVSASKITALSRDPAKLADLKAKGVTIRAADFTKSDSLARAFDGATRALIISTSSMEPGARQVEHGNAVKAAEKAGIDHVIYTSMPKPETSTILFAPDHLTTENAIAASAIKNWTVLRNNWYFENLFASIPQAIKSGNQYTAAAQGKIPYIARHDLARAAAAVLASDSTGKRTYSLTGAKEYTTDDIAKLVIDATGKTFNVVHVPLDGLVQGMIGAGLPEGMARLFGSFDDNTAKGGLSGVTGDYKTLTGQDPQPLEPWIKANAAAFG
jgi:NAD(P)H dehydrogenase (quinone)